MKKTNAIKAVSILAGALMTGTGAFAAAGWGPERDTYTWQVPADHVVFNSITDNPTLGDERNFVRVRKAGTQDNLVDTLEVEPGDIVEVFVYYHNNAGANYNTAANNRVGISFQTKLKMEAPEILEKGGSAIIKGMISSNNMKIYKGGDLLHDQVVWDMAYLTSSDENVYLRYIDGSAVIHSQGTANGMALDGNAMWSSDGVYISYLSDESYWGVIPGCNEYAGYVNFNIKVDKPNFSVEATVKKESDTDYQKEVTVAPGDTVDLKLCYKNTGTTTQTEVTMKDELTDKLSPVDGSVVMRTTTGGTTNVGMGMYSVGLQVGDFLPNDEACVMYKAKVADVDCGTTTVSTGPWVYTKNGGKTDSVKINITRTEGCETPPIEDTCETNPNKEGCDTPTEMPKTGPREVALIAIVVVLIAGATWYYYHSRIELKKVSSKRGIGSGKVHNKQTTARVKNLKKQAKKRMHTKNRSAKKTSSRKK